MPGLFIDVRVAADAARDPALAKKLAEACPVDIFEAGASGVSIVEANLDECTLCDLCLEAAPGKVKVVKLYEREGR
jgi:NAD-dependent dihydropyrimidine dehydrogenase PreA subunit